MWQISVGNLPQQSAPMEIDTALEWFIAVSATIGLLAWPIVFLIVVVVFRDQAKELLTRLDKAGAGPVSFDFSAQLEKTKAIAEALPAIATEAPPIATGSPLDGNSVPAEAPPSGGETELQSPVEPAGQDMDSVREDVEARKLHELRASYTAEELVIPGNLNWTSWISTLDENRRKKVLSASVIGGADGLAATDPQSAIVFSFSRMNQPLTSQPRYMSAAQFMGTAWAVQNLPASLLSVYLNLVRTAEAAETDRVTASEARNFDELVTDFLQRIQPFVQSYFELLAQRRRIVKT